MGGGIVVVGRSVMVLGDDGVPACLGVVVYCERTPVGVRYHVATRQRRIVVSRSQLRVLDGGQHE